jgi:hypothetical protein
MKKENRGGPNRGQGRKSPFTEKTKGVKFMVPISKVDELKAYVARKFAKWIKDGI